MFHEGDQLDIAVVKGKVLELFATGCSGFLTVELRIAGAQDNLVGLAVDFETTCRLKQECTPSVTLKV